MRRARRSPRFTGTAGEPRDEAAAAQPAGGEDDDEGGGRRRGATARSASRQGMNRFTWDMRYPERARFPRADHVGRRARAGPQAPPGRYQVKLTAAGVSKTQDFAIMRNAAVPTITDADLQSSSSRSPRQINDKVTVANEAVLRIRSLKEQIADAHRARRRRRRSRPPAQALTDKLTAVEGEIYQYRNRSSQDPLNYPIRLNNKLAALQGIVESGDAKPTDQSYAVFKDLSGAARQGTRAARRAREDGSRGVQHAAHERKLEPIKDGVPPGTGEAMSATDQRTTDRVVSV